VPPGTATKSPYRHGRCSERRLAMRPYFKAALLIVMLLGTYLALVPLIA
jgi:hypothetical protein